MVLARWSVAREQIAESIVNFPLKTRQKQWLEALFDLGGDPVAATRFVWPNAPHAPEKGKRLAEELAPFILQASLHYGGRILPRCTGIVLGLAEGTLGTNVDPIDPATRLKASTWLIERYDHLMGLASKDQTLPAFEEAAKSLQRASESLEDCTRKLVDSMGRDAATEYLSKQLGAAKVGQLLAKVGMAQARLTAETAEVEETEATGAVRQRPGAT